jgi:hypothetical protein
MYLCNVYLILLEVEGGGVRAYLGRLVNRVGWHAAVADATAACQLEPMRRRRHHGTAVFRSVGSKGDVQVVDYM